MQNLSAQFFNVNASQRVSIMETKDIVPNKQQCDALIEHVPRS